MAKKYIRIPSPAKAKKQKNTDEQKHELSLFFEPLILQFKKELQKIKPNKKFNYVVDIYTKWYQTYFYFCKKYKSESENRIADEFETKFVRLEFISENNFNFSYFRHTDNGIW
ncbi:MAG: hypothetical protein K2Q21_07530 [Chitinophagaceae bacterium]|nr:hypothetical protein [Chitinophagaceae bacterium]